MIDLIAGQFVLEFALYSDSGDIMTGVSPTGAQKQVSVNGGAFATAAGTFTSIGSNLYRYVSTTGEATGARTAAIKIEGATGTIKGSATTAAVRETIVREHIFGGVTIADGALTDASITAGAAAKIAQASHNVVLVSGYTASDLARLGMAIMAGPVTDFTTTTERYYCPVTGKLRATFTVGVTGRTAVTLGDLT